MAEDGETLRRFELLARDASTVAVPEPRWCCNVVPL